MRAVKMIAGLVLALAVVFVVGGLLLPDKVHVERAIEIDRPPAEVYAVLNGFGRFNEWSPWLDFDPTAEYRFEGPVSGIGARMAWHGDKGGGSQEIVAVVDGAQIDVALDFGSDGQALAHYLMQPHGGGTWLVWSFDTEFQGSLVGRWFGLAFDRMIGADYERGLQQLKVLLETPAAAGPDEVGLPAFDDAET